METLVEQNPEIIFITSMGSLRKLKIVCAPTFKNNPRMEQSAG